MIKYYQVVNYQHQPIDVCKSLDVAKERVSELRINFPSEGFYVIELTVVHANYPAHSQP